MSNFLFWSRDSADTAAIAKALAAASNNPSRVVSQGPLIEELHPGSNEAASVRSSALSLADLRAHLPTPRPTSSISSGGSFPSSASALRGPCVRPSSAQPFAGVRSAGVRPSSAPSSTRSRSRSRARPMTPRRSEGPSGGATPPTATIMPSSAATSSVPTAQVAAAAVPTQVPANPYPVNPLFPDLTPTAASVSGIASNMAVASCYPFVSPVNSFTPAVSEALSPPLVFLGAPASAIAKSPAVSTTSVRVVHQGSLQITTGFSFSPESIQACGPMQTPSDLRTTAKHIPSPPAAPAHGFGLGAPVPPPPPPPFHPSVVRDPGLLLGAQQPKTPPKVATDVRLTPPPPQNDRTQGSCGQANMQLPKLHTDSVMPASDVPDSSAVSLPTDSNAPILKRDGRPVRESAAVNPVQFSASATAVSSSDPQAVSLVLQAKQGQLNEDSMNRLLEQDSLLSELADHWSLPDAQALKYFRGRAAWLAVDRDEFTSCVAYFLRLVHRPANAQNSFDIQQDVLLTFCQAIVCTGLPYRTAFRTPGKSWVYNNKVIWELDSSSFPGPRVRAKSGSDAIYRWFHGTTQSSLLGIMKCGRMLRTCNETVGCKSNQTAFGFFGRACYEGDSRAMAEMVASLTFHTKNQTGTIISGTMCTTHHKSEFAETQHEVLQCRCFELIKSVSKDKRWAVRESAARITRFYLTSAARDTSDDWGSDWSAILNTGRNQQNMILDEFF